MSFFEEHKILKFSLLVVLTILFVIAILYTLVIKPRNAGKVKVVKITPTPTPTSSNIINKTVDIIDKTADIAIKLGDKLKNTTEKHITTIRGKFIKIGDDYDDLSAEMKDKVAKCYKEDGCVF